MLYTDPDGFKYRVCQVGSDGKQTNCTEGDNQLSDQSFDQYKKNSAGNLVFTNGNIYAVNQDGSRTLSGTYQQTDVDIDNPFFGAAARGVQAASPVTDPRFIAGFYGASALGGFALYQAGVFAGGEITTLGLGSGTATAETSSVSSTVGAGLRQQINLHKQKLADYIRNPDAFDNKGFLKNASPELRQKIIEGRIRSLEGQIQNFTSQLEKLLGGK